MDVKSPLENSLTNQDEYRSSVAFGSIDSDCIARLPREFARSNEKNLIGTFR